MTKRRPLESGPLAIALAFASGCTSHASDDPPALERKREPERRVEPETETDPTQPAAPDPVAPGPVTPLSLKPFTGALGDVTGDGQVDVVALCHDPEAAALLVLRGASDGRFHASEPVVVRASGIALGDLDGDGDLDAFLTDARGKPAYRVAINVGGGTFELFGKQQPISGRYGGELKGASLVDLDADGDLDAVVPLWDSIRVMPGDGRGAFASGSALAIGRDPFDTALGDLDGDGQLDLVATSGAAPTDDPDSYDSSGASAWIFRGGQRGFAEPTRIEVAGARQVELGDLDGDGQLEVVVSGESGLTVIRDPLGEPKAERVLVATDGPLLLADLVDPPGLDLITSSYIQDRIHALDNNPDWRATSFDAGSFVVGLYAADVAHDGGRTDVIVLNAGPPGGDLGEPAPSIEVLFATL